MTRETVMTVARRDAHVEMTRIDALVSAMIATRDESHAEYVQSMAYEVQYQFSRVAGAKLRSTINDALFSASWRVAMVLTSGVFMLSHDAAEQVASGVVALSDAIAERDARISAERAAWQDARTLSENTQYAFLAASATETTPEPQSAMQQRASAYHNRVTAERDAAYVSGALSASEYATLSATHGAIISGESITDALATGATTEPQSDAYAMLRRADVSHNFVSLALYRGFVTENSTSHAAFESLDYEQQRATYIDWCMASDAESATGATTEPESAYYDGTHLVTATAMIAMRESDARALLATEPDATPQTETYASLLARNFSESAWRVSDNSSEQSVPARRAYDAPQSQRDAETRHTERMALGYLFDAMNDGSSDADATEYAVRKVAAYHSNTLHEYARSLVLRCVAQIIAERVTEPETITVDWHAATYAVPVQSNDDAPDDAIDYLALAIAERFIVADTMLAHCYDALDSVQQSYMLCAWRNERHMSARMQ